MNNKLSTTPYKGTRDFYPDDMAVQQYIFNTWAHVAESFGFERYDASVLEPSELYKNKTNEEIVNNQTYSFTDRGEREVTLRPEMTPTVARMIAEKKQNLSFPVRWYSIPNLFRYERPQKGRLREHWQLNCDIFGTNHYTADVEMIAVAYNIFTTFGADSDMFEIRINDRSWMDEEFEKIGLNKKQSKQMFALLDRKEKIANFDEEAKKIAGKKINLNFSNPNENSNLSKVINGLAELGITNVTVSSSTVRGFTYYTGIVFEIFDTSKENNRSLLGGGRYDNLTDIFGGDITPGVGFGMGDVTMRDFLKTHDLLTAQITSPTLSILPTNESLNLEAEKIAQHFRAEGVNTAVDISNKKVGKKISVASSSLVEFVLVLGEDEISSKTYVLKNLIAGSEESGSIEDLIKILI